LVLQLADIAIRDVDGSVSIIFRFVDVVFQAPEFVTHMLRSVKIPKSIDLLNAS